MLMQLQHHVGSGQYSEHGTNQVHAQKGPYGFLQDINRFGQSIYRLKALDL